MNKRDYEKEIRDIRSYSMEQFDKLIVSLSSGSIAISISFIGNLIDLEHSSHNNILITAWALFAGSLFCILSSQKTAQFAMNKELEKEYALSNVWDTITNILNAGSFVLLFIGIISLILFININI